jgi:hypothetical protein
MAFRPSLGSNPQEHAIPNSEVEPAVIEATQLKMTQFVFIRVIRG